MAGKQQPRHICAWLALGLWFSLACLQPAWATDGAPLIDPAPRLATLEKAISGLEDIAAKYSLKQAEIDLLASSARQQEAKALADLQSAIESLPRLSGKTNLKEAEQALARVRSETGALLKALSVWKSQVDRARQTQDQACADAQKLGQVPKPSQEQISGWVARADSGLTNATQGLRLYRIELTSVRDALLPAKVMLAAQLARLEAFLAQGPKYQAAYDSQASHIAALRAAGQDLAKAKSMLAQLMALRPARPASTDSMRQELDKLKGMPGAASLIPRIDAALAKLDKAALPQSLPEVGDLSPRAMELIGQAGQLDSAAVALNLTRARGVAQGSRTAVSKAQAALDESSSPLAGFGSLSRGRSCLESLRQAKGGPPDQALYKIGLLQSSLEEEERREHLFQVRLQENQQRRRDLRRMAGDAEHKASTYLSLADELDRQLGPVDPEPTIQAIEQDLAALKQHVADLGESSQTLSQAMAGARQQGRDICQKAARATAAPRPAAAEVKAWHTQAQSGLQQLRQDIEAARRGLQVQPGFISGQTAKLSADKDRLAATKDKMLIWLRAQADLQSQLTQARDMVKAAAEMWTKHQREDLELEGLRLQASVALGKIYGGVSELAADQQSAASLRRLEAIKRRASALARRYQQTTKPVAIPKPVDSLRAQYFLRKLGQTMADTVSSISRAKEIMDKASGAAARADKAREASVRQRSEANGVLAEADKCLAALANPAVVDGPALAKAGKAIADCDYPLAQSLLDGLAPGPERDRLSRQLADGLALETELRGMVETARAQYKDCRLNPALATLTQALDKAKCPSHRQSLTKKIELARKRGQYEQTTLDLFAKANTLYKNGNYKEAKALLVKAKAHTSCQRFRESLGKKIAMVNRKAEDVRIVDDGQNGDNRRQTSPCAKYVERLKVQATEIQRGIQRYSSARQSSTGNLRDALGPIACEVVQASGAFGQIQQQARNAGCLEVNQIQNPAGGMGTAAIDLDCHRWKQSHGDRRQTNCGPYQAQKDQVAARQKQLIERYKELERTRAPAAQKRTVACAVLDQGNQIHRIMTEAINKGCNVGGHSVWLPRTLKQACGQDSLQDSDRQECKQYGNQMNSTAQAMMKVLSQMQQLSSASGDNRAALERLACQLVDKINQMKRVTDQAKAAGCPVNVQVKTEMLASFARLCPGR